MPCLFFAQTATDKRAKPHIWAKRRATELSGEESHLDVIVDKARHFYQFQIRLSLIYLHQHALSHRHGEACDTDIVYISDVSAGSMCGSVGSFGPRCPLEVTVESWLNITGEISSIGVSNSITCKGEVI